MIDLTFFILLVLAYLIGAIPTGYWISKYYFGLDITQHGSGNIGATNVARTLGKHYFLPIFLIDAGKAYGSMMLGTLVVTNAYAPYLFAAALLIGNAYSPFLKFRGGKGVATSVGILAWMLPWQMVALFMVCWIALLATTKKAFVASLASMAIVVALTGFVGLGNNLHFLLGLCGWLVLRHRTNLEAMV